jgi:RND superfamily putative drug exporter
MSAIAGWVTHRYVKYAVVAFWLVVVALLAPLAGKLSGAQNNEAEGWLPAQAESTKVVDLASTFVSADTLPAVIVYERDSGLTSDDLAAIRSDVATFATRTDLDGDVVGPIPSQDGRAAQVVVPMDLGSQGWNLAADAVADLRATAEDGANGLKVYVTGPAGHAADSSTAFAGIESTLLYAAIAVVVVMLLLTYRSPILWLLPVVSAGVALTVAQAVVYLMVEHLHVTVNAQSSGILTVLVFGAGTDYALLLVARYREELRRHDDRHEAMALALHRAGPAIVASGATVAVGMLCLLFASIRSSSGLGPVAAVGIVVGLLVMLTLLPALLALVGRWVFWPRVPRLGDDEPTTTGFWARVGSRIARRPRATWVVTALLLAVAAVGIVQLDATGLTTEEAYVGEQPAIAGEKALAAHFAGGAGEPVVVVANASQGDAVREAFAAVPGIDPSSVTQPAVMDGHAYLEGTLTSAPDSAEAYRTVERVRDVVHAVPGADALVGGSSATQLDMEDAAWRDSQVVIPIMLAAVLLILVVLLRALVAPLVLIGTVVLSFGAAMGVSALVYRHVFGFAGADAQLPLFVFVFLVALGIDYNIFLMTRVREEARRLGARQGALAGLAATGGVITSAGFVLAGTFAVLGTLPLTTFVEIAFAVAFGVLLDTIVVRSVLVTALNLDIGRAMWWPSRLARRPDEPTPARPVARVPAGV